MANRTISPERKAVYYVGIVLIVVGFLTFGSVFVIGALNFGNFDGFKERVRSEAMRGVVGMALIVVGGILRGIGSRGLAGSGVVLDPEQARKDVEPWARMAGGVVKDAIDEAGVKIGQDRSDETAKTDFDEKLRKLHKLYQDGIITEEEYLKEKKEVLDKN